MPKTIKLIHHYAAKPIDVWNIAIDFDCLHEVTDGLVSFTGMPKGAIMAGQKINVEVSLFGKLPKQPYYMEVLQCNHEAMTFSSSEHGTGVKSWLHTLSVKPTNTGCQLTEEIVIDAGIFTWLYAIWARYLYKARHQPRLKILARRSQLTVKGQLTD